MGGSEGKVSWMVSPKYPRSIGGKEEENFTVGWE